MSAAPDVPGLASPGLVSPDAPGPVDPAPLFQGSYLGFLPASLRVARHPLRAILVGWLAAFIPSLALSALVQQFAPALGQPEFGLKGPMALGLLVLFAPFVETLIMAGALALLSRFVSAPVAIGLSALGWGIAHSSMAPAWGLVIWWPFLIFSTLYMVWRTRGFWAGVFVAAAAHALQNLGPALLIAYGG